MRLKSMLKTMGIVMGVTILFAMPVMAQNMDFGFYVELQEGNQTAYSDANPKDDNEQAAYVHCTSGDITGADDFYMAVLDQNYSDCTGNRKISSPTATYYIDYNQGTGTWAKESMYLRAMTYAYAVHVYGYWYS